MKAMKKALSLLLVLALALSLAVPAFAAGAGTTGTIIVRGTTEQPIQNRKLIAIKLLDATMVDPSNPSKGISYTVPAELADAFAARYSLDKTDAEFNNKITEKVKDDLTVAGLEADNDAYVKGEELWAMAKSLTDQKTPVYEAERAASDGTKPALVFADLPLGFYLIKDVTVPSELVPDGNGGASNAPVSAVMMNTAAKETIVTLKAAAPTLDKFIGADGKANSTNIGSLVNYTLKSKVPDMTGYSKYYFIIHDVLSKGLTCEVKAAANEAQNNLDITVGGVALNKDSGDYSVTITEPGDGTTVMKIVLNDFYSKYKTKVGQEIKVTYTATLNEDAVVGTSPNPNQAQLEYSNDPSKTGSGENEPGPGDSVTGKTPWSIVNTYTTGIKLVKINDASPSKRLNGAEFALTGTSSNIVVTERTVYTESAYGAYYKLVDGTFTTEAPEESTKDQYESTTTHYDQSIERVTTTKDSVKNDWRKEVGSDGILVFDGVGAGTYPITETKAPDGDNKQTKPLTMTIGWSEPTPG